MPNLLCIVPANYKELCDKGVETHIAQRNLGGYWDYVYTIHPFCDADKVIKIHDNHKILEFRYKPYRMIFKTIKTLGRLIKTHNINAIKAHDPYLTGLLALILSKITRKPYVIMICSSYDLMKKNGEKPYYGLYSIDRLIGYIVMRCANMVFGGSTDATKFALRNGARNNKIATIRTGGVDDMHYLPVVRGQLSSNKVLLYIGRLSNIKFPEDVIRCFHKVCQKRNDVELWLAGDGELREQLEALTKQLGISDSVKFLGFVTQKELFEMMRSVDIILCPLSGSSLVESCLSETPIVAYDVDWHGELILDRITGLMAKFRDTDDMGEKALWLLDNPVEAIQIGKNAREQALKMYSHNIIYQQEAACFIRILSGGI